MRFATWNVNGLRARMNKGEFLRFYRAYSPDFLCLQEIKMTPEQKQFDIGVAYEYWNPGPQRGVSGTAVFSKWKAVAVENDMGINPTEDGGRVITLTFDRFYLVTAYVPTGTRESKREALRKKLSWLSTFTDYITKLSAKKPVILCGDMNIAHSVLDACFPNPHSAGFTKPERAAIDRILGAGFIDSFRYLHPDATGCYSWVGNRTKAGGLRLDYFFVSECLKERILRADILRDAAALDHCPVILELNVPCD